MSCSRCFIANILGFFPPWSAGTSYIEHSDRNILVRNEMHVLVPSLCAVVLILNSASNLAMILQSF